MFEFKTLPALSKALFAFSLASSSISVHWDSGLENWVWWTAFCVVGLTLDFFVSTVGCIVCLGALRHVKDNGMSMRIKDHMIPFYELLMWLWLMRKLI